MPTITVKSSAAYWKKHAKIPAEFFAINRKKLEYEGKLFDGLVADNPNGKGDPIKWRGKIDKLRQKLEVFSRRCKSKIYPKGVRLVHKQKCPYCCKTKIYDQQEFPMIIPGRVQVNHSMSPRSRFAEIYEINPGICDECAVQTAKNTQASARPKGFWDSLFG